MQFGTFLWARSGIKFWPALCVNGKDAGFEEPLDGKIYIFWFADCTISSVSLNNVKPFGSGFGEVYSLQFADMGPKWKAGVLQAIQLYSNLSVNISLSDALDFAFTTYKNPAHEIKTFVPQYIEIELSKLLLRHWRHKNTAKNTEVLMQYIREKKDMSEICLGCYQKSVCIAHPIFEGNLCEVCRDKLYHTLYAVHNERYCYCPICGNKLKMTKCSHRACKRSFCGDCRTNFSMNKSKNWMCVICAPEQTRLIKVRNNYNLEIVKFLAPEATIGNIPPVDCSIYDMLILFFGVSKALEVIFPSDENVVFNNDTGNLEFQRLKEACFQYMRAYFLKTEIRSVEKKHQRDVNLNAISRLDKLGVLVGGTSHPTLNRERNDKDFQQILFWEYMRIFQVLSQEAQLDFKFVFELNPTVTKQFIDVISRFLRSKPVIIKLPNEEYRLVWTNIQYQNPFIQLLNYLVSK